GRGWARTRRPVWLAAGTAKGVKERTMDVKIRRRLAMPHAMLGSSHADERENAWAKIIEILASTAAAGTISQICCAIRPGTDARDATRERTGHLPLGRLTMVLGEYLQLPGHEYLAMALWIAHSFVHHRLMVTPRLALAGCGKTTG